MTTTITQPVFKSKWGFHPCSREDCLKLKEIHRLLLQACRDAMRNIRWHNKDPHNRKGPEPKGPSHLVGKNLYLQVLREYQKARRPVLTVYDVESLNLPQNLDSIVSALKEFYAK